MSRASIVGMLVAAEILIVGMAIFAVRGSGAALGAGMQGVDFTAAAQAPVSAGAAPHVVVDDPNSRVHVGVSSDGLVHVRDLTQMRGAVFSSARYPQLRVTRTADGVLVERPHGSALTVEIFGFSTQAIDVDVPSASRVEIAHCSGADVAGIAGGATVRSQDGSIKLAGVQGTIDAGSDDGSIYATDVSGRVRLAGHQRRADRSQRPERRRRAPASQTPQRRRLGARRRHVLSQRHVRHDVRRRLDRVARRQRCRSRD